VVVVEPRGGQDVADQLIDLVEIGADVGEHVARGDRIFDRELEGDADPGERRAQLVRHGGREADTQPLVAARQILRGHPKRPVT